MALVALGALVMTLRPVLRLPLILAGGRAARSEKQAWWQRCYVDVILLVLGGAALLRMMSTGSALAITQTGEQKADPLLLLAPALLFVALGSLMLRLFPKFMSIAARFFAVRPGLAGALATWQASREPAHYGRIIFLLALSIGIGWFATSFQATMALSQRDQARYPVGTDVRLEARDLLLEADRAGPLDAYLAMPEVQAATATQRFFFSNASRDFRRPMHGELLTVDSDTFGNAVYWRDDLGPIKYPPRPDLPTPGRALPFTPARIGVWVRFDELGRGSDQFTLRERGRWPSLSVRLQDEKGAYVLLPLTEAEAGAFSPNAHPLADVDG